MTNGRKSRNKGGRGERAIVNEIKTWTPPDGERWEVSREGWKQVRDGTAEHGDVELRRYRIKDNRLLQTMRYESKNREDVSDRLWEWVARHDALWLKKNGKPWLVVLPVEEYRRLITK